MNNPFVNQSWLPAFTQFSSAYVNDAVSEQLDQAKHWLSETLPTLEKPSWATLVQPMEDAQNRISNTWSPISHLYGVKNSEDLRQEYEKAQQQLTEYYTDLGQNRQLFDAYQSIYDSAQYAELSQAQRETVRQALRDFKLSGVNLDEEKRARYKEIMSRLTTLTTNFSNNVLDATAGWHLQLDSQERLAGLPAFIIDGAARAAAEKSLQGYVLTLDIPVYMTVMAQADDRALRRELYEAFSTRASKFGPMAGQWDNTHIIEEIMQLRQEKAQLLGYDNYAEYSVEPKMAESAAEVMKFLQDLAQKTKPFAEQEYAELQDFAVKEYSLDRLEAWDINYISEKLKLQKYNVSQEVLRPYFPVDTVMNGLFRVASQLFDITITQVDNTELWHEQASYYEIFRGEKKIAGFYLDLYARENKRSGAWMADCRRRKFDGADQQLPLAFLVCNFNGPSDDKPALLTHTEVTTLFHEFGHGLHHMLTQIDVPAVSGISGVAWDAVELPSQFMENFCWQEDVLEFLSGHYETGEPLPKTMLDNMLAAKISCLPCKC